jgi:hypothetical protein
MVVVDEAYAEFARPGTPSALTLLPGRERLIVTRTMSKAFALAGARLGYLAADAGVCDAFRLVRMPYHLSSLTQAAARAALWHADVLLSTVEAVKAQRDRLVAELAALGLAPVPSDANFVLFGGLDDAVAVWKGLLTRQVLVRDVGIAHHLQVTAGTQPRRPPSGRPVSDAAGAAERRAAVDRTSRARHQRVKGTVDLDLDGRSGSRQHRGRTATMLTSLPTALLDLVGEQRHGRRHHSVERRHRAGPGDAELSATNGASGLRRRDGPLDEPWSGRDRCSGGRTACGAEGSST